MEASMQGLQKMVGEIRRNQGKLLQKMEAQLTDATLNRRRSKGYIRRIVVVAKLFKSVPVAWSKKRLTK